MVRAGGRATAGAGVPQGAGMIWPR